MQKLEILSPKSSEKIPIHAFTPNNEINRNKPSHFLFTDPSIYSSSLRYQPVSLDSGRSLAKKIPSIPTDAIQIENQIKHLTEYLENKEDFFYLIILLLLFITIFGIFQGSTLIDGLNDENRGKTIATTSSSTDVTGESITEEVKLQVIPNIAIGFIVINLIQDVINFFLMFFSFFGVYAMLEKFVIWGMRLTNGALPFFVLSNIFYIAYMAELDEVTNCELIFFIPNVLGGLLVYSFLISNSKRFLFRIRNINELEEAKSAMNFKTIQQTDKT